MLRESQHDNWLALAFLCRSFNLVLPLEDALLCAGLLIFGHADQDTVGFEILTLPVLSRLIACDRVSHEARQRAVTIDRTRLLLRCELEIALKEVLIEGVIHERVNEACLADPFVANNHNFHILGQLLRLNRSESLR